MATLSGKEFVALTRLSTKDDETLALAGETCERVPAASLALLAHTGKIAPAAAKKAKAK